MISIIYPEAIRVEVIATQPVPEDIISIQFIQTNEQVTLREVTYLVKISLRHPLQITSRSVNIYLENYRIRQYVSFPGGIYFKIFNPRLLREYAGKKILFSTDGLTMHDSGYQLPSPAEDVSRYVEIPLTTLPTQAQVLKS